MPTKMLDNYKDERGWIGHYEKNAGGGLVLDDYGLPVLEFGDGVQRMSMNALSEFVLSPSKLEGAMVRAAFLKRESQIWLPSGEPVRHWTRHAWYGKPGTMSGDQLEPLMWCYVVFDLKENFWELFWKLAKRGFFAWNTKKIGQITEEWKPGDFMLHRIIAPSLRMLSRSKGGFVVIPLICAMDLFILGLNTIIRILAPLLDRDNTGDDLNYFVTLVGSRSVAPNPIEKFLCHVYLGLRPQSGSPEYRAANPNKLGAHTAFEQYFYEDAAPPLDVNLIKVAEKL